MRNSKVEWGYSYVWPEWLLLGQIFGKDSSGFGFKSVLFWTKFSSEFSSLRKLLIDIVQV